MTEYGNIIQTVSIFSIIICAPIGAVLISTFGPLYLPYTDPNPPKKIDNEEDGDCGSNDLVKKSQHKDNEDDGPAFGPNDVYEDDKINRKQPPLSALNSSRQLCETVYMES